MTARGGEVGSLVIEALVAVLIVAAMAGLWFQTLGSAAHGQRGTADRRLAYLIAQSRLATVGVLNSVVPGVTSGNDGAFAWTVDIEPAGQPGLARVTVNVTGGDARPLATLTSLRFGR